MNRRASLIVAVSLLIMWNAVPQMSGAVRWQEPPKSQASGGASNGHPQPPVEIPVSAESKKTKKVWTNDDLGGGSGPEVSEARSAKDGQTAKSTNGKTASTQEIASFRKQLANLQTQLVSIDKQIADFKNFSKGEAPGANGLDLHKRYTTEPIDEQVRKLEEKRKKVAAQMDTVLDNARKRGVEPGQLR
jgi:hypothetical protein